MNRLGVNNYISSLQQQIYSSVDKIKNKSAGSFADTAADKDAENGTNRRVESYAYRLLPGEVSWSLGAESQGENGGAAYAAGSYRQAGEVLQERTVLIDLMFKNNREFDFKV